MGKHADAAPLSVSGPIVATCTPFTNDNTIDKKAFIRHLAFLSDNGIENIFVNGTAGEFFSLTQEEKKEQIKTARRHFPGTIILHAGCNSLKESIDLALYGEKIGVDAIASLPPYFLADAPKQGVIDFFNCFAGVLSIPFILYNFPRHTQISLDAEILSRVAHYGMKDSSATIPLSAHTPRYYVGSDKSILKAYKAGARGFVSVRANLFPDVFVALDQAVRDRHVPRAKTYFSKVIALAAAFPGQNQTAMIKYALGKKIPGYPPAMRLPLLGLSEEECGKIDRFLEG
jgi:4-hydroxy-tetrahydrodipicolinate synthase